MTLCPHNLYAGDVPGGCRMRKQTTDGSGQCCRKGVILYGCAYRLSIAYCEKRLQEVKETLGIPVLEEKLKALIVDLEDQYPESKKFRMD